DDLLLPDVEAARRRRQLVRAGLRRPQAPDDGPRARRPWLRGPRAAAHHRLHGPRRLGVGRHAARRRSGRAQGDRLRDAVRRGLRAVRGVRAVRHRSRARARRRLAPRGPGHLTDDARARLTEAGDAITAGVARTLPVWVVGRVAFIADAWGRLAADER